jgi:hypothetical protein
VFRYICDIARSPELPEPEQQGNQQATPNTNTQRNASLQAHTTRHKKSHFCIHFLFSLLTPSSSSNNIHTIYAQIVNGVRAGVY